MVNKDGGRAQWTVDDGDLEVGGRVDADIVNLKKKEQLCDKKKPTSLPWGV